MQPERWAEIKRIFHAALDLSAEERAPFLARECSHDPSLRMEVESLLASYQEAGDAMEHPAEWRSAGGSERDPWLERKIGPYQPVARIGQGGMGVVYRGVRLDDHFLKQVAIKVLRGGPIGSSQVRRFKSERQILASFDHPNITRLLDAGTTEDGHPFLVMECVDGTRIDEYCDAHRLNTIERVKLLRQVCDAVQYAHQRLVVHRDLKPANILVTEDGLPKLLDFGIAKLLEPELFFQTTELTGTAVRLMTPEYASPEQIRGELVTAASDVYSLGVVLYRLLTGHSPHRISSLSPAEMAQVISEREPDKPSIAVGRTEAATAPDGSSVMLTPESVSLTREGQPALLRRRLAGDLDNIVLKALQKDPARRYGSAEQLSNDLGRYLDGLPVLARKDTIRYRTVKFVRRHRMGVAAAALLVVTLVAGVITTSWQAYAARRQRARAERALHDVRQLANSLIFDVDSAIADVRGSTAGRRLLVSTAVRYLNRLAEEAGGDLSLQRELAAGYLKLAEVQGNPFRPNLGDTGGALDNCRKAARMREALAAANPGRVEDQYELAVSYRWLGQMLVSTGDLDAALAKVLKAQSILERLVRARPNDLKLLEQTENVYELIGNIYGGNGLSANLGNPPAALENHRKALSLAEHRARADGSPSSRDGVAVSSMQVGDDLLRLGDRSGALAYFRTAATTLQSLAAGPAGAKAARDLRVAYERIGNAELLAGDARQALASYRMSLALAEKLAAIDPQNAGAKDDLAGAHAMIGKALAESGQAKAGSESLGRAITLYEKQVALDPTFTDRRRILATLYIWRAEILAGTGALDRGLAEYRRAEGIFKALSVADPKDMESLVSTAATQAAVAALLAKKGNARASMESYRSSLAIVEPLSRAEPSSPQALYTVADIYEGIGRLAVKQAQDNSAVRRAEFWNEARSWFERSAQAWRRIQNPARVSPSGFAAGDPQSATAGMALCDVALKKLNSSGAMDVH